MSGLRIAALIMAAGESSRFGGCKHLASINGVPMLQSAINRVHGMVAETYAVTGAWHDRISSALAERSLHGVDLIHNTEWRRGLGHSIAVGVAELAPGFDGVLVLLADQVAITREDIGALLSSFDGSDIACGVYAGRRGVPALFGKTLFAELKRLDGDEGARSLLYRNDFIVTECPMPRAEVDVDTRKALSDWLTIEP